jgi:hypothetical protein
MSEIEDAARDAVDHASGSRLNSVIGVMVAVSATLMALGNIKDGNIVQAMSQAQAHSIDSWSYYQAKSTKQHMTEDLAVQLEIQAALAGEHAGARALIEQRRREALAQAATYAREKAAIQKQAEDFAAEYDRWNIHDDQFDTADAAFSLSIALYGVTALTRRRWLLGVAFVGTFIGAWFGLCGFMHWAFHPDWLTKLLG